MSKFKKISVWVEGYAATGERSDASHLGDFYAPSLNIAVRQYALLHPLVRIDWDRYGKDRHAIWGCEIFDNEIDARRNFG